MRKNMAAVIPHLSEQERAMCWVAIRGYGQPPDTTGLILQDAQKIYNHFDYADRTGVNSHILRVRGLRAKIKKYCLSD